MNSAYYINERASRLPAPSNPVSFETDPDAQDHYTTSCASLVNLSQYIGRCFPRSDRKSLTRHDGFVNKYQPDSQIKREVAELVDAAGSCRWVPVIPDERYFEVSPSFVGSNPTFPTTWQKSRRVRRLNDPLISFTM